MDVEDIRNQTVIVGDSEPKGTGFFIGENKVITNHHVIQDADSQLKLKNSVFSSTCSTVETSESIDIALLESHNSFSNSANIKISRENPKIGETVLFTGYPQTAGTLLTHNCTISGRTQLGFWIEGPVLPGYSGSSVLNSKGELQGVITNRRFWANDDAKQQMENLQEIPEKMEDVMSRTGVDPFENHSIPFHAISSLARQVNRISFILQQNLSTGVGEFVSVQSIKENLDIFK
jgi:hypothetical protein